MVLTWIVFIPAIGGIASFLVAGRNRAAARWISLAASSAVFAMALGIWVAVRPAAVASGAPFLEERASWIAPFGIRYHLAMDGLSLLMVVLSGLLGTVAVAASWKEIQHRIGGYHLALMLLLSGVIGVFLAFDLFLFYFFWELMLVPMYFLIAFWGHEDRFRASLKFFIFTFVSGLMMLVAILGLAFAHQRASGTFTFDLPDLLRTPLEPDLAFWLMLGFFAAFAVKLPAVPFHSWLPDAHTEAPTAGSIILAGLMLKTGAYGFIRFAVPLFPSASAEIAQTARILGVAGIVYGALMAFAQTDFKRLVAYTSVSHLGYVLLGIYTGTPLGLRGAVMVMIAHGLSTAALFFISGVLHERCRTRAFDRLGGLMETAPRLAGFTMLFALASLGLPGMANFIGEFFVLVGAWRTQPLLAAVGSFGFVLSVIYSIRMVGSSMLGPNRNHWRIPDLNAREIAPLAGLAALTILLGFKPQPVFDAASAQVRTVERSLTLLPPDEMESGGGGRDTEAPREGAVEAPPESEAPPEGESGAPPEGESGGRP